MFSNEMKDKAAVLLTLFREKKLMIATAESCTGGMISGVLTEIAGSSDVVDRGFVTYSNDAKIQMLGVEADVIKKVGAVSPEVALAMANGALSRSNADITISVTGVAGPGASENKPAGLVYFGCAATGQQTITEKLFFEGDRSSIRRQTVVHALNLSVMMALHYCSVSRQHVD